MMIDETHDPALTSWVASAANHPEFPIQNLPFGVFSPPGGDARIGTAIGDEILDLRAVASLSLIDAPEAAALAQPTLNAVFALPQPTRRALRRQISDLLRDPALASVLTRHLHRAAACTLHLPAHIGDYTDFYVGIHHATNIGRLFRPDTPLLPNYKYVPIGYHGRASSVRVSGTPVQRPQGQRKAPDADAPVFAPCARLDYELELGVWMGAGNALGTPIDIASAQAHIAGFSLLNDWSARDMQAWEYQPLGPFLAKNFLTSVSPWVVTAEALAPFRCAQPARPVGDPAPLAYLFDAEDQAQGALDLTLEVLISTPAMRADGVAPHRLAQVSATNMYWTVAQLVAHHSSNGCDLHAGDLFGTGTISGPTDDSLGSLIELTRGGKVPLALPNGETRTFLLDGDDVIFRAHAAREGYARIGFGTCVGRVVRARA